MTSHTYEINEGKRFSFGANWSRYLSLIDENKIKEAEESLKSKLEIESFEGKSFLDIGCGSGLFSLAARRLGAKVFSFDFDPQSVACAQFLKDKYFSNDESWVIEEGSVLDLKYLERIGKFDYVYSWGVLHHTGAMWQALANVTNNVASNGKLFIALYNFQPFLSCYWTFIKRNYNKFPLLRPLIVAMHLIYPAATTALARKIRNQKFGRGMSVYYDLFDWLGGYPFEVAKPEEVFEFYKKRGFSLLALRTVGGGLGCNEFVFLNN